MKYDALSKSNYNTHAGNITQLVENVNQKFERYNPITKRFKALQ